MATIESRGRERDRDRQRDGERGRDGEREHDGGFGPFVENLRRLPENLRDSFFRHGRPETDRTRSQTIFSNLFLHLHSTRVNVRTLRFSTTWAMGMASLSFFLILVATGILLMVYYKPSIDQAYDSIKDIHYVVPTGRFIRNIHRWAAHLMVVTVLVHMVRVFFTASYKKPREFNWLVGMVLFVLTLGLSFTGYLLPWDQLAYWAITIGANIAGSPRELTDAIGITGFFDPGGFQKRLLLGANAVGQEALIRFYLLHVMVLPLALAMVAGIHFWRIRKDGGLGRPDGPPTAAGKGSAIPGSVPAAPSEAPRKTYGLMCIVRDRT
ncbi:MAG: cytochrome b N-terminal domain-containing protein, partial [Candidatus Eisenbacteria bacterium]|nr:cytochrome b N-terminal domain-containing protein [Candidatus Eisenbacteria bacterium]